jgi:hypothetical protein
MINYDENGKLWENHQDKITKLKNILNKNT